MRTHPKNNSRPRSVNQTQYRSEILHFIQATTAGRTWPRPETVYSTAANGITSKKKKALIVDPHKHIFLIAFYVRLWTLFKELHLAFSVSQGKFSLILSVTNDLPP